MTVIIGALFDKGNGVLLVSDKMTTCNLILENTPKIMELSTRAAILTTGFVQNYLFLGEAKVNASQLSQIDKIAETIACSYRLYRLKKIQQEILPQYGLWTLEDYFLKHKNFNEFMAGSISEQIKSYQIYVELIVGGVDDTGHIFQITHLGTHICWDLPGVCCLGTGGSRALAVFDYFKYSKELKKEKVLEIAFCAKKRSEKMGGIGEQTDIKIITKDGITDVTKDDTESIEKRYSEEKKNNLDFWN